jgi:hypothetical protein
MILEKTKLVMIPMVIGASFIMNFGQGTDSKIKIDCVSLRMIEQKPAPKLKGEPPPDVIVQIPDDLLFRFELTNNCDQVIY